MLIPPYIRIRAQEHCGPDFGLARAAEIVASGGGVHVTQVYEQDLKLPRSKEIRKAGQGVFGMAVAVYGRLGDYMTEGGRVPAKVSWPGIGSSDVAAAALFTQLISIAATIAETANGMDDVMAADRILPALADGGVSKDDIRDAHHVACRVFQTEGCTPGEAVERAFTWYAARQARQAREAAAGA